MCRRRRRQEDRPGTGGQEEQCAGLSPRSAKTRFSQPAAGRLLECLFSCTAPIRHFDRHRHVLALLPRFRLSYLSSTSAQLPVVIPLSRRADRCLGSPPGFLPCGSKAEDAISTWQFQPPTNLPPNAISFNTLRATSRTCLQVLELVWRRQIATNNSCPRPPAKPPSGTEFGVSTETSARTSEPVDRPRRAARNLNDVDYVDEDTHNIE